MFTKPNKRTLSNSPHFNLDLQRFAHSPQSPPLNSSPKHSFNHHARHVSQNSVLNTLNSDSGRLNTEPVYSTGKDLKLYEDSSLHKIPSQIKKFKDFFHQNLSHLSERSLKNLNYDTLDHLSYYLQSPGSQRLPLDSFGRVQTESIYSDRKTVFNQITYSTPREGSYGTEEKLLDSNKKKRPVIKSRELKKPVNSKTDKLSSAKSIESIYHRKTFSLVSQEILSDFQKESKELSKKISGASTIKENKDLGEMSSILGYSRISRRKRGNTVKESSKALPVEDKGGKEINIKPKLSIDSKATTVAQLNEENRLKDTQNNKGLQKQIEKPEDSNSLKNPNMLLESGNEGYDFERKNSESSQKINNSSLLNMHRSLEGVEEPSRKKQGSVSSINEYAKSLSRMPRKLKKTSSVSSGLKKSERVCATEPSEIQNTKLHPGTMVFTSTNDTITKLSDFGKETKTQSSVRNLSMVSTKSSLSARALAKQLTNRSFNPKKGPKEQTNSEVKNSKDSIQCIDGTSNTPEEVPQNLSTLSKNKFFRTSPNFKSFRNTPQKTVENEKSNHSFEEANRSRNTSNKSISKSPKETEVTQNFSKSQKEEKKHSLKFNFQKKTVKLIKPKPFLGHRGSMQFKGPGMGEINLAHTTDFVTEIERTIRAVSNSLYGSMIKNTASMSKINYKGFQRKLSEQTGISQFEEFLKQDFEDEGGFKRGLTSDIEKLTKKNTLESDMVASLNRMLTRTSSDLLVDPAGVVTEKEQFVGRNTITKPYPIKNWVITVNINPPIEEANPIMEESLLPYPSITNSNDASGFRTERKDEQRVGTDDLQINASSAVNMASVNSLTKSKQYKFELNSRKHTEESIEEEKPIFEDIGFNEDMPNDQSFRKKAETLFTYEGLDCDRLEDFCSRALVARTKMNFFNFLEKLITHPIHQKGQREFVDIYRIDEPKKSTLANPGGTFRYLPRISDIIFKFLGEYNLQQDMQLRQIIKSEVISMTEIDFIEDETQENTKLVTRDVKTSLFQMTTNLPNFYPITSLELKPILKSLDLKALQQMKDLHTLFKVYTAGSEGLYMPIPDNYSTINNLVKNLGKDNQEYLRRIMITIYQKSLLGLFESKTRIEEHTPEVKIEELVSMRTELLKLEKNSRRRPSFCKSQNDSPSTVSDTKPIVQESPKRTKTLVKAAALLRKTTSKVSTSKVINESEEKELSEDKESSKRLGHLKPSNAPRRYSKTTIKPFVSTMAKDPPNLEKFKTAQMDVMSTSKKNSISINNLTELPTETLPEPLVTSKGRTITIVSEDDTAEASNQLQIPIRSYQSNQAKPQTSFLSSKDDKTKIFIEKLQARKNIFTASNTLNSSTHNKSLSPHSDSQIQASNGVVSRSNTNTKPERVTKEPLSYSTLVPPDFRETKTERSSQTMKGEQKDGEKLFLKPPSMQQLAKTIISKNSFLRALPAMKKKKDPIRSKLMENGPKAALFYAIYHRKHQEVEEVLDLYPWEVVNIRDEQENTLLILAAQGGNKALVNLLVERKIEINAQNAEGNTALHYALQYGYDNIADLLMAHGAKQSIMNNKGKTAWEMVPQ